MSNKHIIISRNDAIKLLIENPSNDNIEKIITEVYDDFFNILAAAGHGFYYITSKEITE